MRNFALLFAISLPLMAAPNPGAVQGKVIDELGASISEAEVVIRSDLAGRLGRGPAQHITLKTDRAGRFTTMLDDGFYDLCVMMNAFTPKCRKIKIKGKVLEVQMTLKVDPLVSKSIADCF